MNHPNRNWRRRMQLAADQWIETSEATALIVALSAAPEWGRNQIARDLLSQAWTAGYMAHHDRDGI